MERRPEPAPDPVAATTPAPAGGSMPVAERRLALRVVTMPKDTNHYGTIFGGVVLAYIDQAGFVEARRLKACRWVTAAIDRVEFKAPVNVGDIVDCWAKTTRIGTTSVTVEVDVEVERYDDRSRVPVTHATLVMVAVDEHGRPLPLNVPPRQTPAAPR